jgi:hypothetical protein
MEFSLALGTAYIISESSVTISQQLVLKEHRKQAKTKVVTKKRSNELPGFLKHDSYQHGTLNCLSRRR